jgi:hypothetical protein
MWSNYYFGQDKFRLDTGFGLVIGFIELLHVVTTRTYNTVANPRTKLFTTAHTMSSQFSFTLRYLSTAPNNVLYLLTKS